MWSYKDAHGSEHNNLEQSEIEKLIRDGIINQSTLLKKNELMHWFLAGNSTFFAELEQLPTKKREELITPHLPAPGTPSPSRSKRSTVSYTPFFISWSIAIAALIYLAIMFLAKDRELADIQVGIDAHADKVHFRTEAQKKLAESQEAINLLIRQASKTGKSIDWNHPRLKLITTAKSKAQNDLSTYSMLPEQATGLQFKHLVEDEANELIKQSHWLALGLLLPLLITFRHHYKGSRILTTSRSLRGITSCVMLIPLLNFIGYLIYSSYWNLEGAQRKNALISTLPISLATFVCSYLIYHHYSVHPEYSLYSLIFVAILWAIIHFRFLQMVNYFYRQVLHSHSINQEPTHRTSIPTERKRPNTTPSGI